MTKHEKCADGLPVKNQIIELDIEDYGNEGEGIGHYNGYALFVKGAMAGEKILAKVIHVGRSFGYGKIEEILSASPARIEPECGRAGVCGGCSLLHMDYREQLRFKQEKVESCLARIGRVKDIKSVMEPVIGMEEPYHYRNKVQLPVGADENGELISGFYAIRSHRIVKNTGCLIQYGINDRILSLVFEWMKRKGITAYDEKTLKGDVRHIMTRIAYTTGQIMTVLVINRNITAGDVLNDLIENLKTIPDMTSVGISYNPKNTNVIFGETVRTIYGTPYIEDCIGDVRFRISAQSFFQVNPVQTLKLYETALEFAALTGNETVWDLYCGIGTISLFLARSAKHVYGIEIVKQAVDDAKDNAALNNITNATFIEGAAELTVSKLLDKDPGAKADVVVVDPPRKGLEINVIDTITGMQPDRVVYVSCEPSTLARDVAEFARRGYELKRARCTDMFPHSFHVETVCLLSKKP